MTTLKFLVLAIAIALSIVIVFYMVCIIVAFRAAIEMKTKMNFTGLSPILLILCALAWSAYFTFF